MAVVVAMAVGGADPDPLVLLTAWVWMEGQWMDVWMERVSSPDKAEAHRVQHPFP